MQEKVLISAYYPPVLGVWPIVHKQQKRLRMRIEVRVIWATSAHYTNKLNHYWGLRERFTVLPRDLGFYSG